jgi:hypothetical protein
VTLGRETARELSTLLESYQEGRDLTGLVGAGAVLWISGRVVRGRDAVVTVLLGDAAGVEWIVGTGRGEALCSAEAAGRHVTMLLKAIRGTGRWSTSTGPDGTLAE